MINVLLRWLVEYDGDIEIYCRYLSFRQQLTSIVLLKVQEAFRNPYGIRINHIACDGMCRLYCHVSSSHFSLASTHY